MVTFVKENGLNLHSVIKFVLHKIIVVIVA